LSTQRFAILILLCAAAIAGIAFGTRQSFGLFMVPITDTLGWGRESLSLVFAVQALLNGLGAPFAGAISDKWGTGRTVFGGGVLYAIGLVVMSQSTSMTSMFLGGSLLIGMGVSACGMPVLLAAAARVAAPERRSMWLGVLTAGGTGGQLLIIPLVQYWIQGDGWRAALMALAIAFAVVFPLAACLGFAGQRAQADTDSQTLGQALAEARHHSGYWLLILGFFVCGFQVQFVGTHLPAFIEDQGLGKELAATSLMVIAGFNMFGAWIAGYLGGKWRKKYLLTSMYLLRAILIAAFVSLPITAESVLAFSAIMGFVWLGTVPLTSGLVMQVFGTRYMATLFAVVYLSHQAGNFCGAWMGGWLFDTTGSYIVVWWLAAALGLLAALVHAPLNDKPLREPDPKPASAV
jgi:MFS family permease